MTKIKREDCTFLLQSPLHNNLGDHSIIVAEKKFINDALPEKTIVELPFGVIRRCSTIVQHIVKKSPILIHGGGFIGSVWHEENKLFQKILTMFPDNKIIIFPQTVNYQYETVSENKLYTHKNISLCARELKSYSYIKANFPFVNLLLIPDMTLYLNPYKTKLDLIKKDIIMCMRDDKEKEISPQHLDMINKILSNIFPNEKILHTDTIHDKLLTPNQRMDLVQSKINDFAQAKLIVTDRLHGMIFAVLANTPCIAYGKNDGCKMKGVFEWVKNCANVVYINDNSDILYSIKSLSYDVKHDYNVSAVLKEKYNPLISLIKDTYRAGTNL